MEKDQLVSVYIELISIDEDTKRTVDAVSDGIDLDSQETEILLDELDHMGLIEEKDDEWIPLLFNQQED